MDLTRLSLTLFLIPLLAPAVALGSNSNAKPSESFAIGDRPTQPLPKKRVEEERKQSETKKPENQLIPTTPLCHERPSTNQVLQDNGMNTGILDFLCHSDYIKIKALSRAWNAKMCLALAHEQHPLVLPEGQKLVDYTNKLFAAIPESFEKNNDELKRLSNAIDARLKRLGPGDHLGDEYLTEMRKQYATTEQTLQDEARLAIVKNLIRLHLRSDYPEGTAAIFYKAFRLYPANVPRDERIITYKPNNIGYWATLPTEIMEKFSMISREPDETTKLEELKPLLKKWSPFGIFLKLAATQSPYLNEIRRARMAIQIYLGDVLNLLEVPQLSDNPESIHRMDPKATDLESDRVYDSCRLSDEQCINVNSRTLRKLACFGGNIGHNHNLAYHMDCIILTKQTQQLILDVANKAFADAAAHPDKLCQYLAKAVKYWERIANLGLRPLPRIHGQSGSQTHAFSEAAISCYSIAQNTSDAETKAAYYKKEAYFLSTLLASTTYTWGNLPDDANILGSGATTHSYLHPARLFHWAAHAHTRAAEYCSIESEKNDYLAKAKEFERKAILVEKGRDKKFNRLSS